MIYAGLIAFVVITFVVFLATRQHFEFKVVVRDGRLVEVLGNLPGGLRDDFAIALKSVSRARISAHKERDGMRLIIRGDVGDGLAQRLRNMVGAYYR